MLDIHRLEIFVKVADMRSFSKAAHEMYLTQPTVSQHITSLEQYLGQLLFDRLGKDIALTRAGEILYKYAKKIIGLTSEARQALDDFMGKKSGHLLLGASTIPGEYILPELLGAFKVLYPDIRVTLSIGDTEHVIHDILTTSLDMGIVGAKIKNPFLHYTRFLNDELVIAVPPGHHWWASSSIEAADLMHEPFIMREPGSGTRISMETRLRQLGIKPESLNVIAEVGSTTAVKQAIKAGLGISLISARAVAEDIQNNTLKKVLIKKSNFTRLFYTVRDRRRTPSPLCKAFVQFLSAKA